ncbi:hypothetical protein SPI_09435 [Niveomyces insectorum RCEF 264]|uniref:Protein kinase-like domain protein n=1 Tax=Niveomyces insectorum RCEF 264 TaxID=1081102 RepID=A0A167LU88_9HYPO|nr:hypothetical protein SPI_09435 [Niveomyces insectorum RCEF 264]
MRKTKKAAFIRKLVEAKEEVVCFVGRRLGWTGQAAEFVGFLKGLFNLSVVVRHGTTSERALIRFPMPGNVYGPWRETKVRNEAMAMAYLTAHTRLPIPRVHGWGPADESPQQLGPFLIEDFVEGTNLGDLLKQPTANEADPDTTWRRYVARQCFAQLATDPTHGMVVDDDDDDDAGAFRLFCDDLYWRVLHKDGVGEALLDKATLAEKDRFLQRKRDQFAVYWAEKQNDARFQ